METAGLYWTAAACHKKALSILTISDHIYTGEALSAEDRQESFHGDDGSGVGDCPGGALNKHDLRRPSRQL